MNRLPQFLPSVFWITVLGPGHCMSDIHVLNPAVNSGGATAAWGLEAHGGQDRIWAGKQTQWARSLGMEPSAWGLHEAGRTTPTPSPLSMSASETGRSEGRVLKLAGSERLICKFFLVFPSFSYHTIIHHAHGPVLCKENWGRE